MKKIFIVSLLSMLLTFSAKAKSSIKFKTETSSFTLTKISESKVNASGKRQLKITLNGAKKSTKAKEPVLVFIDLPCGLTVIISSFKENVECITPYGWQKLANYFSAVYC